MVRRSSRLRDKAKEANNEISSIDNGEDEEMDDIESLVQVAYDVIKENVRNEKELTTTETMEEEEIKLTKEEGLTSPYPKVSDCHTLSSELKPGVDSNDIYFKMGEKNSRTIVSDTLDKLKFDDKKIMKKSVITPDFEKKETAPVHTSYNALMKQKKLEKEKSTGSAWFNMAAPEMTPELKRDLNIIKMRAVLDPKRHYKKNSSNKLPKYFQIGTVVSGPAEFYSSRIPKSQRKKTIVESLLSDAEFRRYNKRKFLEIQASKQAAGRKGFHKRLKKRK